MAFQESSRAFKYTNVPQTKKLTQHFQEMIAEEDPDGDGIVTKEEFTKMLERKK